MAGRKGRGGGSLRGGAQAETKHSTETTQARTESTSTANARDLAQPPRESPAKHACQAGEKDYFSVSGRRTKGLLHGQLKLNGDNLSARVEGIQSLVQDKHMYRRGHLRVRSVTCDTLSRPFLSNRSSEMDVIRCQS